MLAPRIVFLLYVPHAEMSISYAEARNNLIPCSCIYDLHYQPNSMFFHNFMMYHRESVWTGVNRRGPTWTNVVGHGWPWLAMGSSIHN
jgi:hypothetical protein